MISWKNRIAHNLVSARVNRLNKAKRSVKIRHLEFFEGELEKRELLATTSFSSGMLSINLNAAGEILTLTNDGSKINISSTAAITGAGSSFATSGVTGLSVTNSGSLAGQSFNFCVGATFTFSQSVSISDVGSVLVNNPIATTGSANITITGVNTIQTAGTLTTAGGAIELAAKSDIVITQPILTNGGVQTLKADSDIDGVGSLSLNFAIAELQDPNPNPGNQFGVSLLVLPSGNVVVTSPYDDAGGTDAGAVYLFNGFTGQLISTLRGTSPSDNVGSGRVTALTNGHYVVRSPSWDNGSVKDVGAVTWANGTTGITGSVSSSNSLVGTTASDQIGSYVSGYYGVTALTNGNYVVRSPSWDNGSVKDVGAVTWANGTTGITGSVSPSNSLVGTTASDQIGFGSFGVTALTNGNYVVSSPSWDSGLVTDVGAVTWGNGSSGITGSINHSNSLVGTTAGDKVGSDISGYNGVTPLTNGNYVVCSSFWDNDSATDAGAVTWGNGSSGIIGRVSSTNSLIGTTTGDQVGSNWFGTNGVTALANGNYLVCSPLWDNDLVKDAGAVTWGNGITGISGSVSHSNSLVGTTAGDQVGYDSWLVVELTNGNYVVASRYWDNGSVRDTGAVTWGNGTSGISGNVSSSNSLIGTSVGDQIGRNVVALTNGNYVVISRWWDNGTATDAGAVTWGNGTKGISGNVTASNSLVGSSTNDLVGDGYGVVALTNGNYVVCSSQWNNGLVKDAGAVTWGNGTTGISGNISATNSLVGTTLWDRVGRDVTALTNGNYVVCSFNWTNGNVTDAGAVTWGNGTTGISGNVSSKNSLVGTTAGDRIGSGDGFINDGSLTLYSVTALTNGNYVVCSPNWDNGSVTDAGAVTWGNGNTGIIGNVTSSNSLVGSSANDLVGDDPDNLKALPNGNYVVRVPKWDNRSLTDAGAVTWGNGTTGITGNVSATNSIVGKSNSSGTSMLVNYIADSNSFFISYYMDGSGRVLYGSQSSGFESSSGSLNSGGGSIDLQGNHVKLQTQVCTTTANSITFTADRLNITDNGGVNATTTGNLTIRTFGSDINLGNGTDSASSLGLSQGELSSLTAGTLTIGSNITGNISLTNNLTWSSNLVLSSNITVKGTLSNANHIFTQGSNNVTAVGTISIVRTASAIILSEGNNQSTTVGADFANLLKVRAIDSDGNPVPNVAVTFTVNAKGADASFASTSTVNTDASGYATAPRLTANTVSGVFTVTASATGLSPLAFNLTNNAGAASAIAISDGSGQTATVNGAFAKTFKAKVTDSYGNPVPGVSVSFTAPDTGSSGTFASSSTVTTNASGMATAPVFTANTVAGTYLVAAASAGLTTQNFSLTNNAGAATSIAIVDGNSQSTTVATTFAKSLQVVAKDTYGNLVPGLSVVFTAPSTGASGTFATSSTVMTNASGLAVAPNLTANTTAGAYTVLAAATGLITQTFTLVNNPATASTLAIFDGNNQTATVGVAFAKTLQVIAKDSYGNPVPGVTVTFSAPSSGASGSFANSSTVTTNTSGVGVSPVFTANSTTGTYTVSAVSNSLTTQIFTLTNVAGASSSLTITDGNSQSATVGTDFATLLKVQVTDSNGNPVPNVAVTFTVNANGASASFASTNVVNTDVWGYAKAPKLTANTVSGVFTVTASATGLSPLTFTLTNNAGAASALVISGGNGQEATVNTAFVESLQARVTDTYGNPVSGFALTFTAPSTGAGGTFANAGEVPSNSAGYATAPAFTANTVVGKYNVTVTGTGLTSKSISLMNNAGAATTISIQNGNNQSAAVGTAFANSLQVIAKDTYGNAVPGVSVVFTAPGTGASGTFETSSTVATNASGVAVSPAFTANTVAGTYLVSAASTGLATLNFNLTNNPGAATSIAILDGNSQSASVGTVFAKVLQVIAKDTYGNSVPGVSVTFTVPSTGASSSFAGTTTIATNASGVASSTALTANTIIGSYNVTASATGLTSQNFSLANTAGSASMLSLTAGNNQSATVDTDFATLLQIQATDAYGNPVPNFSMTFTVNANGAGASFASSSTVTTSVTGYATASKLMANTVSGVFTVIASAAGLAPLTFVLTNNPGAAATIIVSNGNNQSTPVNTAFAQALQVRVTDTYGNPVGNTTVSFTAPSTGATGTFTGSASVATNATGYASAPTFTAKTVAGSYRVTAASTGLTSKTISLTNTPGAAASLTIQDGNNQSATVGTMFAKRMQMVVKDSYGNLVPGASVSFTAPSTGASGNFASSSTLTSNASGLAILPLFTANTVAGNFSVNITANGNLNNSITLTNLPGAVARLAIASGDGQFTIVSTPYSKGLQVLVTDIYNNPVPNVAVTFSPPSSGAAIVSAGSYVVNTNASGKALLDGITANKVAGVFTVIASVPNLHQVSFSLNNNPGAVGSLIAVAGNGQSTVINGAFSAPLQVKVVDVYGNILSNVPVTFNSPSSGALLTFATNNTIRSDGNGLVVSPTMKANGVIGTYIVTGSTPGASNVNFTMANVPPKVQSLMIQLGAAGRSFIRNVGLTINDFGTVASIISSVSGKAPRISLTNTGLTGTKKKVVALKGLVIAIGNTILFDFGSKGLGGNAASNAADGSYLISLDLDGNGSLETTQRFWRLLGDVNGDKVVDAKDTAIVNANLNKTGFNVPGDTNGDGKVNSTDVSYVRTAQKRKITV